MDGRTNKFFNLAMGWSPPSLLETHVCKICPGWPTAGRALGGVNFARLDQMHWTHAVEFQVFASY